MMKTYKGYINKLESNQIFVFGSNVLGQHGKGAAKIALDKFGAIYGKAQGLQGQSYAIITKDLTKSTHPSRTHKEILEEIYNLYVFANLNPGHEFLIAYKADNANLNGYSSKEMAAMFKFYQVPSNIIFEEEFNKL